MIPSPRRPDTVEYRVLARGGRLRVEGVDLATQDKLDQAVGVEFGHVTGRHAPAVAEDGDAIGQLEDLLQPVRDVQNCSTLRFHIPQHCEEVVLFHFGEGCGGLVEHQDAACRVSVMQGPDDRGHRATRGAEPSECRAGIDVDAVALEDLLGVTPLTRVRKPEPPRVLVSECKIVVHRKVIDQGQVLMDESESAIVSRR